MPCPWSRWTRTGEPERVSPGWAWFLRGARRSPRRHLPTDVDDVPHALDRLVDAAVTRYLATATAEPVMLIHASTAPRAARLALPSLPIDQWSATYDAAWAVAAAITVAYPATAGQPAPAAQRTEATTADELAELAVANHDEHVIKFVEVVAESHARGNTSALPAGAVAAALISPGW